ncbi:MAG: porin family protein [candidate division Zixibacteria bacterium]|nr:porin family protein [candidate division Zixibacteria bacterium]
MKRSLHIAAVVAALALITVAPGLAREFNPALVGYGGKIGFSLTNVSNHPQKTENHTGYLIGGLCNYPKTDLISFQIEIMLSGKGFTVPDTTVYDTGNVLLGRLEATWLLQYIEMPVLAKLSPIRTGKYRPYVIGGGYAAFLVHSKLRLKDNLLELDYDVNNTKGLDVGGIGGVGIDMMAGRGWVFFEIRYEQGLMSVIKDTDYKSHALSFQAGYWF